MLILIQYVGDRSKGKRGRLKTKQRRATKAKQLSLAAQTVGEIHIKQVGYVQCWSIKMNTTMLGRLHQNSTFSFPGNLFID